MDRYNLKKANEQVMELDNVENRSKDIKKYETLDGIKLANIEFKWYDKDDNPRYVNIKDEVIMSKIIDLTEKELRTRTSELEKEIEKL